MLQMWKLRLSDEKQLTSSCLAEKEQSGLSGWLRLHANH